MRQRKVFIEARQDLGMDCFESKTYLERTSEQIPKAQRSFSDQSRMAFDYYMSGEREPAANLAIVFRRDSGGVEEAAAVVKLKLFRLAAELFQRIINLPRYSPSRHRLRQGRAP